MQAVILVNHERKQVAKAVMEKSVFNIGREKTQDLVLDGKEVSRLHITLRFTERGCEAENRSANGTLLNKKLLAVPTPLKDGDVMQIGPYELRVVISGAPAADAAGDYAAPESEATRFVGAEPEVAEKIAEERKKAEAPASVEAPSTGLRYSLIATSGAIKGNKYKDWQGELTLGRGLDNNVVIPDDAVSVSQARIRREGDTFYLEDVSTSEHSNGVFLNGYRIRREKIPNAGKIRMGNTHFVFFSVDVVRKKKLLKKAGIIAGSFILLAVVLKFALPKDIIPELLERASDEISHGKFEDAGRTLDKAASIRSTEPGIAPLRQKLDVQKQLAELLAKAQVSAEKEEFDVALETCYQVFRLDPSNQKAKDLEKVIKSISEARIALGARNWSDAARLLERVSLEYPKSELLKKLLAKARSEIDMSTKVSSAKAQMDQQQYQAAHELLAAIPSDSVYFAEAADLIKRAEREMSTGKISDEAAKQYQAGHIPEALAAVDRGLAITSTDDKLVALKQKISVIAPLAEKMRGAAPLLATDDVAGILLAVDVAAQITKLETDKGNALRAEADQTADRFRARLKEIAQMSVTEAETKVQAGDRKGALVAYLRAAKADPSDATLKQKADDLRRKVTEESQKYFREGRSLIELGMKKEAAAAFEKVLGTALPGDDYYNRAAEELRTLK